MANGELGPTIGWFEDYFNARILRILGKLGCSPRLDDPSIWLQLQVDTPDISIPGSESAAGIGLDLGRAAGKSGMFFTAKPIIIERLRVNLEIFN